MAKKQFLVKDLEAFTAELHRPYVLRADRGELSKGVIESGGSATGFGLYEPRFTYTKSGNVLEVETPDHLGSLAKEMGFWAAVQHAVDRTGGTRL